jgi:hypothetical protein
MKLSVFRKYLMNLVNKDRRFFAEDYESKYFNEYLHEDEVSFSGRNWNEVFAIKIEKVDCTELKNKDFPISKTVKI